MKLKEFIKLSGEKQTIHLIVDDWRITASGDALKCCANDELLNSTITSIAAEDAALVVCASSAEEARKKPGLVPEHDSCEGCRYFDLAEEDEPCAHCKGTAGGLEVYRTRRDCYELKEG